MHYQTKEGHISHLYNEQAIERKAWEKHGGPKGGLHSEFCPNFSITVTDHVHLLISLETLRGSISKEIWIYSSVPRAQAPCRQEKMH